MQKLTYIQLKPYGSIFKIKLPLRAYKYRDNELQSRRFNGSQLAKLNESIPLMLQIVNL